MIQCYKMIQASFFANWPNMLRFALRLRTPKKCRFATAKCSYLILTLNHPKINKIRGTTLDEGCSKSYELMQLFGHGSASSEYDRTSTQHGPTLTWCTWWFRLDHGWLLLILIANFHGNQCLLIWWLSTPIIADPISASRGSCLFFRKPDGAAHLAGWLRVMNHKMEYTKYFPKKSETCQFFRTSTSNII